MLQNHAAKPDPSLKFGSRPIAVSCGFVFLAFSFTLGIFQQRQGGPGVLEVHPDDQIRRQAGQCGAAQFASDAVGAQQSANQVGFVAPFGLETSELHAPSIVHMGQLRIFVQVAAARNTALSVGVVRASALAAHSFGWLWFCHMPSNEGCQESLASCDFSIGFFLAGQTGNIVLKDDARIALMAPMATLLETLVLL